MFATIYNPYSEQTPLAVCEHVPTTDRRRFFVDVDSKDSKNHVSPADFDILDWLPIYNAALFASLPESLRHIYVESTDWKALALPIDKLKQWHVEPKNQNWAQVDWHTSIVLESRSMDDPNPCAVRTYHVIYPFLFVTEAEARTIREGIRDKAGELPYADYPQTLRAPFCDRPAEGGRGMLGRPFDYHCLCNEHGESLSGYPSFLLPTDIRVFGDVRGYKKFFSAAVWALASLRWPLFACCFDLDLPNDVALPDLDPEATTDAWRRAPCFFDPKKLEALLSTCASLDQDVRDDAVIVYMNSCFAYINASSPPTYVVKMPPSESKKPSLTMLSGTAFRAMASMKIKSTSVSEGEDGKRRKTGRMKSISAIWEQSYRRRSVDRLAYRPKKKQPDRILNTYPGRRFHKSQLAECEGYTCMGFGLINYLEHILNVWCASNFEHFKYVLSWMASVYKNPGQGLDTTLVLIGPEGCGKSTPARPLGLLLGDTFWETSQPLDVVGRFSGHLCQISFVIVNELDHLTDEQAAVFRGLVTDNTKRFEWKGLMTVLDKEHPFNFIITSNGVNKNVFRTSPQSRRLVILDCQYYHMIKDPLYFAKMIGFFGCGENSDGQMRGVKCIGQLFNNIDIDGFNSRDIPLTDLLREQKLMSMPPEHLFIKEAMDTQRFVEKDPGNGMISWHYWAPLNGLTEKLHTIYAWYLQWCNNRKHNKPCSIPTFASTIKTAIPSSYCFKSSIPDDGEEYMALPGSDDAKDQFYRLYVGVEATGQRVWDPARAQELMSDVEKPWVHIKPEFVHNLLYTHNPLKLAKAEDALIIPNSP